ncbi:MAG: hypothetical protein HW380_1875 [Magnetococcales bacterium]|nr:hypothetical protein [Magnetococcales bacterium]
MTFVKGDCKIAPLRGRQSKAPGLAGGYLLLSLMAGADMNINTGFFVELIKIFFKDCTENCPYLGLLLCIFIFLTIAVGLAGVIHVKRKVVISFNNMNVYFTRICNYINLSCFGGNIDKFLSVRDILDEIDVLINKSGVSLTPGNFIAIKYSLVKIRELTVERCSCERFGLLIVLCWLWFKIKDIFTDKIKKIEEFSSNFENAVNNSNLSLKNEILEKVNEILKVVRSLGVDNFGKIKSLLEINTNNEFSNSISAFNRNDHASLSNDVYFRLYLRHALLAKSKKQIEEMDASSQTVATPSNPSVSSSGTGSSLATGASTSSSQGSVRSPTPGEELMLRYQLVVMML